MHHLLWPGLVRRLHWHQVSIINCPPVALTWFYIRLACQRCASEMFFICALRGRYELQQSSIVVRKCVHLALAKIGSFEHVTIVGINWDHKLFCLLYNFCSDPRGTLVSIGEVLQCRYVYLHAALFNPSPLSGEVWVACGIYPIQPMDGRQCSTGCGTKYSRNIMDW